MLNLNLQAVTGYISDVIHGRDIFVGNKKARWTKVESLKVGAKIAVAGDTVEFDEVVSIQAVGREQVWDIEVEGSRNFVGNSILAHNTYAAIFNGGNVGIGTTAPIALLNVVGNSTATASAIIQNSSTTAATVGLAIKMSATTLNTTSRFINFLDLNGTIIGKIQAANTTSVNYAANGTDFAEYFVKSSSVTPTPGDVITLTNDHAAISATPYDSSLIGIVSSGPAFTGGTEGSDKVIVALVGQVPVKIASTSATINIGDYLTSSSIPGRAVKADHAGFMIAKALESWTAGSNADSIKAYVSPIWADPNHSLAFDSSGNLTLTGSITTKDVILNEVKNPELDPSLSLRMTDLESQVASISAELVNLKSLFINQNMPLADQNWQLATESGQLVSIMPVQVPELTVTGNLSVGLLKFNDMTGDISSLTGLLSLNNGVVTIDEHGNFLATGAVTAAKYNVDTTDVLAASAGKVVIPAGLTQIAVDTTSVSTASSIFVTPEKPIAVSAIATQSGQFVINIPATQSAALKVNWWIIN